jgi:hypothetical protein
MSKNFSRAIFALSIFCLLMTAPADIRADTSAVITVPESNDFATRILNDPWDMNQFSDVSRGLNLSGRKNFVSDFSLANGVFSGMSTPDNYAWFYTLFPGYLNAVMNGKVGARFPISTQQYHCLYVRMRVQSPSNDVWYVFWHAPSEDDGRGQAYGMPLHDNGLPNDTWGLYSADLATASAFYSGWSTRAYWQALRIHPTNTPNVRFDVDWARLTDCAPVNATIQWAALSGQTRLWAGIGGAQQKDIPIHTLQAGQTTFAWDTQGLMPGLYSIGVETSNGQMTWLSAQVQVLAMPQARFARPSPETGMALKDAASAQSLWAMTPANLYGFACTTPSFSPGQLHLSTPYPAALPPDCRGVNPPLGEADARFFLRLPQTLSGADYRYLVFRHYINGPQPEPADGMIGRLIWWMQGCVNVSLGIPYDVGWHEYVVDLHDPVMGYPEDSNGCGKVHWKNSNGITSLRFDPNENWTGNLTPQLTFEQIFEGLRLTKTDRVQRGQPYDVSLAVSSDSNASYAFYYTTDVNNPTQNAATLQNTVVYPRRVFFPALMPNGGQGSALPSAPIPNFVWQTASVQPGEYYLCAVISNAGGRITRCSEAPVQVY